MWLVYTAREQMFRSNQPQSYADDVNQFAAQVETVLQNHGGSALELWTHHQKSWAEKTSARDERVLGD